MKIDQNHFTYQFALTLGHTLRAIYLPCSLIVFQDNQETCPFHHIITFLGSKLVLSGSYILKYVGVVNFYEWTF